MSETTTVVPYVQHVDEELARLRHDSDARGHRIWLTGAKAGYQDALIDLGVADPAAFVQAVERLCEECDREVWMAALPASRLSDALAAVRTARGEAQS
jgi:hypothetical protein